MLDNRIRYMYYCIKFLVQQYNNTIIQKTIGGTIEEWERNGN